MNIVNAALEFLMPSAAAISSEILAKHEPVIGLEVHVKLLTASGSAPELSF